MACENFARLTDKHPPGTRPDPTLATAVQKAVKNGRMTCTAAHSLASELAVAPSEIGRTLDLLDYRIIECQMGLFGYSPVKKIVQPAQSARALPSGALPVRRPGGVLCRGQGGTHGLPFACEDGSTRTVVAIASSTRVRSRSVV